MKPRVAILLGTFDRYERLAVWTRSQIERQWPGHPPVYFSGLSGGGGDRLPLDCEPGDWMGVTLGAAEDLSGRGFTHAYLVLDDHPPLGRCDGIFLVERLPALAQELGAAHVSLLGYGQHRRVEGQILGRKFDYLERLDAGYRWKFSLHPGLWNLDDLRFLLGERMKAYAPGKRTPWNFEKHRDEAGSPVAARFESRCFRICGCRNDRASAPWLKPLAAGLRFAADLEMFCGRLAGGKPARQRIEARRLWVFGYYGGPYPIFWSGCLRQGKRHADFEKWLSVFGPHDLESSWRKLEAVTQ